MFYKSHRLDQFLTTAQRELVEQDVNEWIHEHGSDIYGNVDQNGQLNDFSSHKKDSDFWVGFAIGLKIMGTAEPVATPRVHNQVDKDTEIQALMDKNSQLQRELKQRGQV